ncbi:MAG TPA: tail fiber domain-containing protein [Blastocatellia bacterium]|nr:tail fiber domain-containing protein [Blastocatellia bacterium]
MKTYRVIVTCAFVAVVAICLNGLAVAQSIQKEPVASFSASASEVRWEPHVQDSRLVLVVSTPGGKVIRKEFKAGKTPSFNLTDDSGMSLPNGQYTYELSVVPNIDADVRDALIKAREKGNGEEVMERFQKEGRIPEALVQSGSFQVQNGVVFSGRAEDGAEPSNGRIRQQSVGGGQGGGIRPQDIVNADDLIVQGSACVGLDCVNNESFGFDTIRLKENNTRIKFDDTSSSAGFPANDWQLTANDSASGGASKFSIEDITGAKVPFTITAGASTNSIFVDSTGRVGLRTSTPVLDLHANTSNTPAFRLEQNNSGGFTAQTWDIAGNEANFFVRDVTGGSLLPFRIRPGAPTSSIDINASGNVGIGTASPSRKVEVSGTGNVGVKLTRTDITNAAFLMYVRNTNGTLAGRQFSILDENALADRFIITSTGNIGIGGLLTPTNPLEHTSGARLTAGGVWTDASSRALKTNIRNLTTSEALKTLKALNPVQFEYKAQPGENYVGFIAEDVPDLVAASDRKSLSPMDIVAVLTKVIQAQQKSINELKARVAQLESPRAERAKLQTRKARSIR